MSFYCRLFSYLVFWLSCPSRPALAVLSFLSWPGCIFKAILSRQSCPNCPVLAILFWLSCPGCPALAFRFCMTYSSCPGSRTKFRVGSFAESAAWNISLIKICLFFQFVKTVKTRFLLDSRFSSINWKMIDEFLSFIGRIDNVQRPDNFFLLIILLVCQKFSFYSDKSTTPLSMPIR